MSDRSQPEHIRTHLSEIFLFEAEVFKVMRPVRYPFVDFSTKELRRAACEAEVIHNRPWAPGVYLGVVDYEGEPAVHMRRLPADRTLVERASALSHEQVFALGAFLRVRHDASQPRPASSTPAVVWERIDTNFAELRGTLRGRHSEVFERLFLVLERQHRSCAELLKARQESGRGLHGDLRCEHVYVLGESFAILDGVAFSEELASGDPIEDVAFLAMDLGCTLGRWDRVAALWQGWGLPGRTLLTDLYAGHRSLIRAKVAGLSGDLQAEQRHLLSALVHWEEPVQRPVLVGLGGLPGVGKSTLARGIAEAFSFQVVRTDVVRKRLMDEVRKGGPEPTVPVADYSVEGRSRVYDAVLETARESLGRGERVLVDASLGKQGWREALLALGEELGIPVVLLFAEASAEVALRRIRSRKNDASDADEAVYALARSCWEPLAGAAKRYGVSISTEGALEDSMDAVQKVFRARGVA